MLTTAAFLLLAAPISAAPSDPRESILRAFHEIERITFLQSGKDSGTVSSSDESIRTLKPRILVYGSAGVPTLSEIILDRRRQLKVRVWAATFASMTKDPGVFLPLSQVLLDPTEKPLLRETAAFYLPQLNIPKESLRKPLCEVLKEPELPKPVLDLSLERLEDLGCDDPAALIYWGGHFGHSPRDKDSPAVRRAINTLGISRSVASTRGLLELYDYFTKGSPERENILAQLSHKTGHLRFLPAKRLIISALSSESKSSRSATLAMKLVSALKYTEATDNLERLLRHPDPDVVAQAAHTLADLKAFQSRGAIVNVLSGIDRDRRLFRVPLERRPQVISRIRMALGRLNTAAPGPAAADPITEVSVVLADEGPAAGRAAIDALPPLAAVLVEPLDWDLSLSVFGGNALPQDAETEREAGHAYGGKIGLWTTRWRSLSWLDFGAELDITRFTANSPLSAPPARTGADQVSLLDIAVNAMVRLPLNISKEFPQGRWHPYLGVGYGIETAAIRSRDQRKQSDGAAVVQAPAGIKVFLRPDLAVFGEYKHTSSRHAFYLGDRWDQATVKATHVTGGLAWHMPMRRVLPRHAPRDPDPWLPRWDFSVGAFAGSTLPEDTDFERDASAVFGGKVTAWNQSLRHKIGMDLGLEFDATRFSAPAKAVTPATMDLRTLSLAINMLARCPIAASEEYPRGRWHPYMGIGWGAAIADARTLSEQKNTDFSAVFQAPVGLKVFLTPSLAIFGEYKYTVSRHRFDLDKDDVDALLRANHLTGGLSLAFSEKVFAPTPRTKAEAAEEAYEEAFKKAFGEPALRGLEVVKGHKRIRTLFSAPPWDLSVAAFGGAVAIDDTAAKRNEAGSFGGKIGLWNTAPRNQAWFDLGAELDITRFKADTNDPKILANDIRVLDLAANIVARFPVQASIEFPQGRWHPYIGVGGGFEVVDIRSLDGRKKSDISPLVNFPVGLKIFLTRNLALFGEYKLTQSQHDYSMGNESGRVRLRAQHLTGGVSLHFPKSFARIPKPPKAIALEDVFVLPAWDFQVSGFAGASYPQVTDEARGVSSSFGGKLGAWNTQVREKTGLDLGLVLDITRFSADSKEAAPIATSLRALAISGNLLMRRPMDVSERFPHGRWYPYAGIGFGAEIVNALTPYEERSTDLASVLQIPAGFEFFVTPRLSIFGEYKFTASRHSLGLSPPRGEAALRAAHLSGGVSLHFGPPDLLRAETPEQKAASERRREFDELRAQERRELGIPEGMKIEKVAARMTPPPLDLTFSVFGGAARFSKSEAGREDSSSLGGKIGLWTTAARRATWLDVGAEFDVTRFSAVNGDKTAVAVDIRLLDLIGSLLIRLPIDPSNEFPQGRWHPYIGVGYGLEVADIRTEDGKKKSNTAPVVSFPAGIKVFVNRTLALFAEYKMTDSIHRFSLGHASVQERAHAHHIGGGMALHIPQRFRSEEEKNAKKAARAAKKLDLREWDWRIAAFGGAAYPQPTDEDREVAISFGGKIGAYNTRARSWSGLDFGAEADITRFSTDSNEPEILATDLRALLLGFNLLVRKPFAVSKEFPNGRWYPYAGFGMGSEIVKASTPDSLDTGADTALLLQVPAGIEYFLTPNLAFFGEYKFTRGRHRLSFPGTRAETDLQASHLFGGFALHFASPDPAARKSYPRRRRVEEKLPPIKLFNTGAKTPEWDYAVGAFGGAAAISETLATRAESRSWGAKVGAWNTSRRSSTLLDFGAELDLTRFSADTSDRIALAQKIKMTNFAGNFLVRLPIAASDEVPFGRWHPYMGLGLGFARAQMQGIDSDISSNFGLLLQIPAGLKFFVSRNLALFTEYKFTSSWNSFRLNGQSGKAWIRGQHIGAGVAAHF